MIAALLLLFASGSQLVVDEVYQIPPGEWRWVEIRLKQAPVAVDCEYRILSGDGAVRAVLVNGDGLDDLRQGDRKPLGTSPFNRQGQFSRMVNVPDEYAVVIENRGPGSVGVRLQVSLDFSGRGGPPVRLVSPARRLVVILISSAVFLAIVVYSARRLLAATR